MSLQQMTYVRLRAIEENSQKIVYRGGSGGSMLLLSSCKNAKSGSEKRSLNRLIPALNFINERSSFGSF